MDRAFESSLSASIEYGAVVISVTYEAVNHRESGWVLKRALTDLYVETVSNSAEAERPSSCVILLDANIADSHLVRALFELYRLVVRADGRLACVGYPIEFLESLTSLGMLELPDFDLHDSSEAAKKWLESC